MNTLTSQYTPTELYELIQDTLENMGSGGGNAILTSSEDIISIQKSGSILLEVIKEVDGKRYVTSQKELELYDLYQLFELFENVCENHLLRKEKMYE